MASNTIAVLSVEHETRYLEQGDQAKPMTSCKCPLKVHNGVQFSWLTISSSLAASPKRSGTASFSEYVHKKIADSERISKLNSGQKKSDKFKNCPSVKNSHFLFYPHETQ